MNKTNVAKFFKNAKVAVTKHSPEILTGIGIAGMVTTTILAVKATPKALRLMELKKEAEQTDKLTPVETVKTTWKCNRYRFNSVSGRRKYRERSS